MAPRRVATEAAMLPGPEGELEALIDRVDDDVSAVAVVCHPHPLHGGTMTNKVVHTLARSLARQGAVSVRFNFRGIGASAGSYGDRVGETLDALAVIDWAVDRWPGLPVHLGGFSFGAAIALRAAGERSIAGLVTVEPPVERFDFESEPPPCPWLLIQGSDDEVVSATAVRRWWRGLTPRPSLAIVDSAGHFFHGKLRELDRIVTAFPAFQFRTTESAAVRSC